MVSHQGQRLRDRLKGDDWPDGNKNVRIDADVIDSGLSQPDGEATPCRRSGPL